MLTRQWLELTISAYRSRIAYLPDCTRLCYPERNASSCLNRMILFTEKKGFQSIPNNKITFKLSHQKNQDIKKSGCYGSAGTPIPFDFVVLCRRSVPLPFAYMYIECALCTHVGFKKGIRLYKKWGI